MTQYYKVFVDEKKKSWSNEYKLLLSSRSLDHHVNKYKNLGSTDIIIIIIIKYKYALK